MPVLIYVKYCKDTVMKNLPFDQVQRHQTDASETEQRSQLHYVVGRCLCMAERVALYNKQSCQLPGVYACMYACVRACVHVCKNVCMYVCMHACMC